MIRAYLFGFPVQSERCGRIVACYSTLHIVYLLHGVRLVRGIIGIAAYVRLAQYIAVGGILHSQLRLSVTYHFNQAVKVVVGVCV